MLPAINNCHLGASLSTTAKKPLYLTRGAFFSDNTAIIAPNCISLVCLHLRQANVTFYYPFPEGAFFFGQEDDWLCQRKKALAQTAKASPACT